MLVDDVEAIEKRDPSNPVEGMTAAAAGPGPALSVSSAPSIPPPPPEDALDPSFFDDNGHDIMNMDSVSSGRGRRIWFPFVHGAVH